jgi:hypothetical protein
VKISKIGANFDLIAQDEGGESVDANLCHFLVDFGDNGGYNKSNRGGNGNFDLVLILD